MTVPFQQIPNNLLTPGTYIEYDSSRAVQGLAVLPNRALLVGARLAAGTVAENTLAQVLSPSDAVTMFGRGSQLAQMAAKYKLPNESTELWAIASDVTGTAATKTITFGGAATAAGTLHFLVQGVPVDVAIADGDDDDAAAAAVDAAFGDLEADWGITFAAALNVVTGTARHAAAFSEDIDIQLNYYDRQLLDMPPGLTVVIADGVAGATNPSQDDMIAALGDEWFTTVVLGFYDATSIASWETEAARRIGALVQQDMQLFAGHRGAHADHVTLGDGRNSEHTCIIAAGPSSPHAPWQWAAAFAAVSNSIPDPATPRQNQRVLGILPSLRSDRFDRSERQLLLEAGIGTYLTDNAGAVYIERLPTTYKTSAGVPDTAYRNLETMLTNLAFRYTARVMFQTRYPNHKLAGDDANYGVGQRVITPKVARGELLMLARQWELNAWLEDYAAFKASLVVERNASDPDRLDWQMSPNHVNQARVIAGQIQFIV